MTREEAASILQEELRLFEAMCQEMGNAKMAERHKYASALRMAIKALTEEGEE